MTATSFARATRWLHAAIAAVLILLMLWGFQHFYFHGQAYPGRELTPPIRTLIILHGTVMAAWIVLFLAQPVLIATGRRHIHMMLGKIGAVIAAGVVILGLLLGVESTRVNPPDMKIWSLSPKQFMAVPIISILIFGGFVAAGIVNRRRREIHRSMMLLATLAAIPAAVSRIDVISALYLETVWERLFGPFFGTLVVSLIFLIVKWALTRSLDRYYAWGCAGLAFSSLLIMQLATTQAWDRFAGFLLQ